MAQAARLPERLAVLADLDGTLIDSRASAAKAFRWWARLRGLPDGTAETFPFGRTSTEVAALLAPELDPAAEGELLELRQAQDTAGVVAVSGAKELLETHRRLAIVTSGTAELARARLAAAGLPAPEVLLTAECWERGKPDPEPYIKAMERLAAQREDCLVLEDSPPGVQSGVAAGIAVIAILTSYSEAELAGASAFIPSLEPLVATVARLRIASSV
ncbi:MAG: HAD-IA family hydrolase [Solirubrobacteraceae bacterium]|jgi:sugar-phosphatase